MPRHYFSFLYIPPPTLYLIHLFKDVDRGGKPSGTVDNVLTPGPQNKENLFKKNICVVEYRNERRLYGSSCRAKSRTGLECTAPGTRPPAGSSPCPSSRRTWTNSDTISASPVHSEMFWFHFFFFLSTKQAHFYWWVDKSIKNQSEREREREREHIQKSLAFADVLHLRQ